MNAPPCLNCCVAMRCHRVGAFLELMAEREGYQIWSADVFRCEQCGATIASGFGQRPVAEHWQIDYDAIRQACRPLRYWSTFRNKAAAEEHVPAPAGEQVAPV